MPKVVVTGPDKSKREFIVDRELTLGRETSAEIQILEEKASRRHCRFRPNNGAVIVEDLGSSNGTKVNGRRITQQALKHGDVIIIGQFSIEYEDEANRFDRTIVLPEITDADIERRKAEQKKLAAPAAPPIDELIAKSSEPTISEFKSFDEDQWNAARAPERHEHDPVVVLRYVGMGVAAIIALAILISFMRAQPVAEERPRPRDPAPSAQEPIVQPPPPLDVIAPPTPIVVKTPVIPPKDPSFIAPGSGSTQTPGTIPVTQPNTDAAAELAKVLAERDKALGANNFAGARSMLNQFITTTQDTASKERAVKELQTTTQIVEAALDSALNEARQAAAAKKYRLATQLCTRLISIDPQGRFGNEARSILTRVDDGAAQRYQLTDKRVDALIRAGQFDQAHQALEGALDELGGTKWAEPVSAEQLQVLMSRALIRKFEEMREKLAAGNRLVPLNLPARKLKGTLQRVSGAGVEMRVSGATLSVNFRDISPLDFDALKKTLSIEDSALEEAYFWQMLGRAPLAQAALERALENPAHAALAQRLVSLLPGQKNLRIYDFSKWQHQSDWDALSGSWSTVNDKYVLESADGGDTVLRLDESSAIDGDGLRVGFEFELVNPAPNAYFAFEFGSNEKAVSLIFSQDSITIHSNVEGAANEKHPWKLGAARVEAAFTGAGLEVAVNGNKLPAMALSGLKQLKGTLVFRVREAAVMIDNVIARNVAQ